MTALFEKLRSRGVLGVTSEMSNRYWAAKTALYFRPQFRAIGRGSIIRKPLMLRNPRGIRLGQDTRIRDGARLELVERVNHPAPSLDIGNRVLIEQGVHITCCQEIVIGDDVAIAARCSIVDVSHPLASSSGGNLGNLISPGNTSVNIGSGAFLGVGVVVLPNVSIGENTVVGANSVVTRDLPANCVAAGSPARVLRSLTDFSRPSESSLRDD